MTFRVKRVTAFWKKEFSMNILIWTRCNLCSIGVQKYFLCFVFSVTSEAEDEQVTPGDLSVENIVLGACFGRTYATLRTVCFTKGRRVYF